MTDSYSIVSLISLCKSLNFFFPGVSAHGHKISAADMMFVPDAFAFLDPRSEIIFPVQNILTK
jgi:hypothetical protein